MTKLPKIIVVILGFNHKNDLIETIESFVKQDYNNLEIVLSDNGSVDNSLEYVKKNYHNIIVIENKENLGWAKGNNVGIKEALKREADYVLLSNNDIFIEDKNLITKLANEFEYLQNYNTGIIGTTVNYYNDKDKIQNRGWNFDLVYGKKTKLINKYKNEYRYPEDKKYLPVDFVSGCFILIDVKVINKNGLLDENYFLYCEDQDFCYRAWKNGYNSIVINDLIIYHKTARSTVSYSPLHLYYLTRNKYYFLKKYSTELPFVTITKIKRVIDVIKMLVLIVLKKNKFSGSTFRLCKSVILGQMDAFCSKYGERKI